MTLIALLHKNSFPMAITDNLISTEHRIKDYQTPETPLNTKEHESFRILGMASKIWRYGKNGKCLFLLYAGTVSNAQDIFEKYSQKFSYSQDDSEMLDIFHDLDRKIKSSSSNLDVTGIFLHNSSDQLTIYNHDFGDICWISIRNNELIEDIWVNIIIAGGSGAPRFLEIISNPNINYTLKEQLKYVYNFHGRTKDSRGNTNLNNTIDYYYQCIKFSLNSVALATIESVLYPEYSLLTYNACGALYNLRHFIELYPKIEEKHISISDTGLCQIFTEDKNGNLYINKFILTNYTDENITVSFVLNCHISINEIIDNEHIRIKTDTDSFDVFEIHDRYKDSIKRKIENIDKNLLNANQLIVYRNKDKSQPSFGVYFLPWLAHDKKLVSIVIDDKEAIINIKQDENEKVFR